jgi:WD40 repeat protein
LQESDPDPTTALLISRLAAEQAHTQEAETSLRTALQALRLQDHRQISQKPLQQVVFSPQAEWFATVDTDGQLVVSSLRDRRLRRVLRPADLTKERASASFPSMIAFSPDGKFLVADVSPGQVAVWSVETGELQRTLGRASNAITQVVIHPPSHQVAITDAQSVKVWNFTSGQLQSQGTHRHAVKQLQFNSDGSQLLVGDGRLISLMQVEDYQTLKTFASKAEITAMSLTVDDQQLAITTSQGTVQVWNIATGKLQQTLPGLAAPASSGTTREIARLFFSPNGEYLVLVGKAGQIQVVQLQTGQRWELEQTAKAKLNQPHRLPAIAFSPDSRQIIIAEQSTIGTTQVASFRDAATGREFSALRSAAQALSAIQFSPDGSLLAATTINGAVQLWNTELGGELLSLKLPATAIQWAGFQNPTATKDENILAIGRDGTLRQWPLIIPKSLPLAVPEPVQPPPPVSNSDFRLEKVLQGLHQIRGWLEALSQNLMDQRSVSHVEQPTTANSLQPNPVIASHGTNLQATSSEPGATLMTMATPVVNLVRQMGLTGQLTGVAISRNSTLIAIANQAGLVEVWQIQPDRSLRRLYRLQSPATSAVTLSNRSQAVVIHQLAFSPNGHHLLGVGLDKSIHLWNLDAGDLLHQFTGHEALIEQAHFSSDGSRIISASWDRTARIWDVASGQLITTLPQPDVVTSARFSADNQRVVVTSLDGTARVIDASTGSVQVILAGHRGAVLDGEFSPDSQWVVTASADGSARLWDATTGVERTTLRAGKADKSLPAVKKAFFSASGQHVATLDSDGTLNLWVATWAGLLEVARDRSLRQLTPDECLRYLRLAPAACPSLQLGQSLKPETHY